MALLAACSHAVQGSIQTSRRSGPAGAVLPAPVAIPPPTTVPSSASPPEPVPPVPRGPGAVPNLDGLHFTDITQAAGVAQPQSAQEVSEATAMTGGVAACDLNGDGLTDLFVTRVGLPNELLENNGDGTFTDIAASAGVGGKAGSSGSASVVCGDLNGDGRPDLYVTGSGNSGNDLYLNEGNGTFRDVTAAAGLTLSPVRPGQTNAMFGSAIGDFNHDGRMDLVTLQWDAPTLPSKGGSGGGIYGGSGADFLAGDVCSATKGLYASGSFHVDPTRSRLYRNDGNGPRGVPRFTDVTRKMGLDFRHVMGFQPSFVDLTGNGWDDLVVTGDACTSQIYMNEKGRKFVDVTRSSGASTAENGMGSVFVNLSGDGLPDWFETSIYFPGKCPTGGTLIGCSGNRLYVNEGNGKFSDQTDRFGLRDGGWGWGAVAVDFANTGHPSILQVDGMVWSSTELVSAPVNPLAQFYRHFAVGAPRLWWNDGKYPFPEVSRLAGLVTSGQEKAVVPIDVLHDGRIGVFITNTDGNPVLFRNDIVNTNGWATVRLHDNVTANRFGVGAKVRITASPGGPSQEKEVRDGGSYESSNPLQAHFGFGPGITSVAEIDVFWPGRAHPQVLHDVPVDRYVDIVRD